jgi:hypothetical protein
MLTVSCRGVSLEISGQNAAFSPITEYDHLVGHAFFPYLDRII